MKLIELTDHPFNGVEISWHGPFPLAEDMIIVWMDYRDLMCQPGVYRAESSGQNRKLIKYIGSASESFAGRLNARHRIKTELVDGQFRNIRMFLGAVTLERRLTFTNNHYVEVEYILRDVPSHDLDSWHGLATVPVTSRGRGWRTVNKGERGA